MILSPPFQEQLNTTTIDTPVVEEVQKGEIKVISKVKSDLGYNCVKYARSKKEDLPMGLWTLQDKKNKIKTEIPQVGSVGVTAESVYGHMVVVEEIKTTSLLVSEGNYITGYITTRNIPKDMVLGYI
ncbi:MAG: CHAP domain-containing protein [Parcubacteria group bacterium]